MTHNSTLPEEWTLSENEEKMLGEKHVNEYHQKVEEYSNKRTTESYMITSIAGLSSLFVGGIITIAVCGGPAYSLPTPTNVIIGLSIISSIVITSMTLAALISRKAQVPGMQNPKDWKKEILGQEASKKEGSYGTFGHTVENIPAK